MDDLERNKLIALFGSDRFYDHWLRLMKPESAYERHALFRRAKQLWLDRQIAKQDEERQKMSNKVSDFQEGDHVVFHYPGKEPEDGVVTSTTEKYVFVRFGYNTRGLACNPADLRRPHVEEEPGSVEDTPGSLPSMELRVEKLENDLLRLESLKMAFMKRADVMESDHDHLVDLTGEVLSYSKRIKKLKRRFGVLEEMVGPDLKDPLGRSRLQRLEAKMNNVERVLEHDDDADAIGRLEARLYKLEHAMGQDDGK